MEEIKLCVFVDYMLLCTENPKKSTHKKNLLEAINEFSKVSGYKINTQKATVFLHNFNKQSENKIKKTILFIKVSKNKILKE